MPNKILIQLDTPSETPAAKKLRKAFSKAFIPTSNPDRFWVEGSNWAKKVEGLWAVTLEPNGIPVEITSLVGMDRAMTEEEWQNLLKGVGISESLLYSVVATDWGDGDICACPERGIQWQDEPGPQVTQEEAVNWKFLR